MAPLDIAAIAAVAAWLLVVAAVRWARRPAEAHVGPKTMELGSEPPAVANLLVNDFYLTRAALPATLLDLAARDVVELQHRGPGEFICRLNVRADLPAIAYEARVFGLLQQRARNGVVPPEALTTGPGEASAKWWRGFRKEVVDDCQARGLSRDLWNRRTLSALTAVGFVPAPLLAFAFEWRVGAGFVAAVFAFVGVLRSGRRQRDTPAGLEAASRWLGVRAQLRENEVLSSTPAITVALWERHLAYAAAFGLTGEASRLLGLGTEEDTRAWSAHGGRWRQVRVSYPTHVPPGWGLSPLAATIRGFVLVAVGAIAIAFLERILDGWTHLLLAPAVLVAAAGLVTAVCGLADARSSVEVTGPILRLRKRGSDDEPRYYVAIDDGSDTVRAWRLRAELFSRLSQDEVVTASVTPRLRYVRAIRRSDQLQ